MTEISLMQQRPPFVRFDNVEVEDRDASIEAGYFVPKNIPHAIITPPGGRDSIHKEVTEWLKKLKSDGLNGITPLAWYEHFSAAFEQWKLGNEIPEFGTPVLTFLPFTPAQRAALIAANIRTVEDCAEMSEDTMQRVGMGARELRDKAINALGSANVQVALIEKQQAQIDMLEQQNEALIERLNALENAAKQPKTAKAA
jgi:hypothetical protein